MKVILRVFAKKKMVRGTRERNVRVGLCQNTAGRKASKKYLFASFEMLELDHSRTSNKPTQSLLDYGNMASL